MPRSLVSIIIPTWNSEQYLKEAVDSALAQTYEDFEVIVVDDGSTDKTKDVLSSYVESGRIKYIYQENKGLAGARNTGLKISTGTYIALLDSDDLFLPEKIENQVEILEKNPDFGICYSDLLHFTDTEPRKFFRHRYIYPSGDIFSELLKKQFINPLSVVARKSVFDQYGLFDEKLRRSEDWELWLRFARGGVKFYYLNKILAHYRVRNVGNLSSVESEPEMKEKNLMIFQKLRAGLSPEEVNKYNFDSLISKLKIKLALAYLMVGRKNEAIKNSPFLFQKIFIRLIPGKVLKFGLGLVRKIKHRCLLKKI